MLINTGTDLEHKISIRDTADKTKEENRETLQYNGVYDTFTHIFYEKLFKSLEIHCFTSTNMPNKNYKLVISITLAVSMFVRIFYEETRNL